jgi:hypothetical protein
MVNPALKITYEFSRDGYFARVHVDAASIGQNEIKVIRAAIQQVVDAEKQVEGMAQP